MSGSSFDVADVLCYAGEYLLLGGWEMVRNAKERE